MPLRLPSPFAIYAFVAAGIFGIVTTARGLVDSDYYWHIAAGRLLAERGVMSVDPFSYTWEGQPWVMHEWLGELLMHWLVTGLGVGPTAFLFGIISVSGPLIVAGAVRANRLLTVALRMTAKTAVRISVTSTRITCCVRAGSIYNITR